MALIPTRMTLSTTAQRLDAETTDSVSGSEVVLFPQAAGTIVVGGADTLTAANGVRITVADGDSLRFPLEPGEKLYGILAAGTLAVDVLGFGQ